MATKRVVVQSFTNAAQKFSASSLDELLQEIKQQFLIKEEEEPISLVFDEDGTPVKQFKVLQPNDRLFALKKGETHKSSSGLVATLQQLLNWEMHPKKEISKSVILRGLQRYSALATLAVTANDPSIAVMFYDLADQLPKTQTEAELKLQGYQLAAIPTVSQNENILTCFKETVPCALKILNPMEAERTSYLLQTAKLTSEYIVRCELVSTTNRTLLVMPLYPITLADLKKLSESSAMQLWKQMSDALTCLHSQGFAHMDIKPSNICIDECGNFVLIDLGSAVPFGTNTSVTRQLVPAGVEVETSPTFDWWMLAATVVSKMNTTTLNTTSSICQYLEQYPTLWAEIRPLINNKPMSISCLGEEVNNKFVGYH